MTQYSRSFNSDGGGPRRRPPVDWKKLLLSKVGFAAVGGLVFLATMFSSYTYVEPGYVAVIKNNVTGTEDVQTESGIIIHLPFGMTDVFQLDRTPQVFEMKKDLRRGDRKGADHVRIKVADGSNVEVDVSVNYKIIPTDAAKIIRTIGPGDAFKNKMIRGFTRALIREKYGTLTLEEIANPANRTGQNTEVKRALNDALAPFGVEVTLINTTDFNFNVEYERLVRKKKATAQQFTNQKAAQEQAQKEQETKIAEVTRKKRTAIIQASGIRDKRLVEVNNKKLQMVERAGGEAYAKRLEGDRSFEVAKNEAQAVEAEGLNKAAGITRLVDAYAAGGTGLVKEALARKLYGVRIVGRPYSLSERIDRLKVESAAAVSAPKGGAK